MKVNFIDVWHAYTFFFRRQHGAKEWLKLSLWMLIPIVGWSLIVDYRVAIATELDRNRNDKDIFGPEAYLQYSYKFAGLMPYATLLSSYLLMSPLVIVLAYALDQPLSILLNLLSINPHDRLPYYFELTVVCIVCTFTIATTLSGPMLLYQYWASNFRSTSMFLMIWKMTKRCPGEFCFLLSAKFAVDLVLINISLLTCGIFLAPALVMINIADQFLMAKWYQSFIDNGGAPIPGSPSAIRAMRKNDYRS